MPRTGTPSEKIAGSNFGAAAEKTLAGPPESMMPTKSLRHFAEAWCGRISEYTRHSRTRRAMTWVY